MANKFAIIALDVTQFLPVKFAQVAGRIYQFFATPLEPMYINESRSSYQLTFLKITSEYPIDKTLYDTLQSFVVYDVSYIRCTRFDSLPHKLYEHDGDFDWFVETQKKLLLRSIQLIPNLVS